MTDQESSPCELEVHAKARCLPTRPMEEITDTDFGRYVAVTQSLSTYVVELGAEESTLIRTPADDAVGRLGSVSGWDAASLRRDREAIPLLGIIRLRVGVSAIMRIDVRGDGVETTRVTTPVSAIRRLPE